MLHYGNDQQRTRAKRLCKEFQGRVLRLGGVVNSYRCRWIKLFGETFLINRYHRSLARWYLVVAPPFMTDLKLVSVIELEQVAAVRLEHAAEFRNDDIQEPFKFYRCGKVTRQTVDDRLASLMHSDLAFKGKLLGGFEIHLHKKVLRIQDPQDQYEENIEPMSS